jgi:hypothetical protein
LEGEVADVPFLRVEGIVLELDLIVDLAIDQLRKEPLIEKFLAARGDQPAFLIEVDVVCDRGADPEHEIFGERLDFGLVLLLKIDVIIHHAPGHIGVDLGLFDELLGEDAVEEKNVKRKSGTRATAMKEM